MTPAFSAEKPTPTLLKRFKATVAYDGTDFEGWQSQTNKNTIQDILERRLAFILEKPTRIYGSGRTDSGVHARGQVFHFEGEWNHPPLYLQRAFASNVPDTIQVLSVEVVDSSFDARKSATGKRYIYYITEGCASPFDLRFCHSLGHVKLDVERMQAGALHLIGKHDFTAFSGTRPRHQDPNPIKELRKLTITRNGPKVEILTEGSGYMYKMVRSLAGALIDVGKGKLPPDELKAILESKVRTALVPTAPAKGLFLDHVFYD